MQRARSFTVVGAGISGLYAALLLARRGCRVRVIERARRSGGLAGSETFRGIPCDLGSHRLHPAALEQPLFAEMHAERPFLSRPRRGLLLFADRRVSYPPSALGLFSALGPRTTCHLALDFATSAARRRGFRSWERDRVSDEDLGFERFVVDRVGAHAYQAFYRPYAEKVWGLPAGELSQTVAKKRLSSTRPLSLVRSWVGRVAARGREKSIERFVYPAGGVSSIIDFLEQRLRDLGVPIEHDHPWSPDEGHDGAVLYAGDLRDLVPTSLQHRGLYLVYLALPTARLGAHETYYSPDPRYWFGRVSELQNYSPELRRDGETILCVEVPEGAWGTRADFASGSRRRRLVDQLVHAGVVPAGLEPVEVRQVFLPGVYPLYRRGWLGEWRTAMRRAGELGDIIPFGRQALFLHCNLDHCAAIAADAVEHALSAGTPAEWTRAAERYVDLRVRD
jgi:hypothetical protein